MKEFDIELIIDELLTGMSYEKENTKEGGEK